MTRATAEVTRREIERLKPNLKSANQNRTLPPHKTLASSILRRNIRALATNATIVAADKTSAATVLAIAGEDVLAGEVDVDAEGARKVDAICRLPNMHRPKAISAHTNPAVTTNRAARNKAAVSSRAANIGARKARASPLLRLLPRVLQRTKSCCRVNPWRHTETSRRLPHPRPPSSSQKFTSLSRILVTPYLPAATCNRAGQGPHPVAMFRAAPLAVCHAGCSPNRATKPRRHRLERKN